MNQFGIYEKSTYAKEFINEIEKTNNYNHIENFFRTEEKMLEHLFRLEKKETQRLLRLMIDDISKDQKKIDIKYYFITLSSIVARALEKRILTPREAFAFNGICITLIDQKLDSENAVELGDELVEFYTYVLSEKKRPFLRHTTVNSVIHYINEVVEASMTVEGIAKKFNVSTSHLSRIFREHTEITLVEYINIRKVEESQYYLRFSDKSIAEISNQFHFCNQSYFTRIFKKYTGETPKRFRGNLTKEYFSYSLPAEENIPNGSQRL